MLPHCGQLLMQPVDEIMSCEAILTDDHVQSVLPGLGICL